MEKHQSVRVRILVKAFPQPSRKHEETVCCAGITEDGGRLLRLYPIRFRRLPKASQFARYDLVEMTVTKAPDPRPESYRVDEGSIRVVESGDRLSPEAKVRLWQRFIAPSLEQLLDDNRATNRSLGIVRPDPETVRFVVRPALEVDKADIEIAEQVLQAEQSSLFEEPLQPLEKPEFAFTYRYKSAGRPHEHVIHDWEVQAAYRAYQRRYGVSAMDQLKAEYGQKIPAHNLHFIMGTMAAHPRTFIVIGLLRSPLDPAELGRQGSLL